MWLLCLVPLFVAKSLGSPLDTAELIFGGRRATQSQWPWQVYLDMFPDDGGYSYCGGTLITRRHVLTAAHCLSELGKKSNAMLGIVDKNAPYTTEGAQVIGIKSSQAHPNYKEGGSYHNDIGIITLDENANLTHLVELIKIKADDQELLKASGAYVTGYGTMEFDDGYPEDSRYLLYARIPFIDYTWCKNRWDQMSRSKVNLWDTQICAGAKGKGVGNGDSGGPIQVFQEDWYQVGISSFNANKVHMMINQAEYPAVYTRLAKYCHFMATATNGEFKCV